MKRVMTRSDRSLSRSTERCSARQIPVVWTIQGVQDCTCQCSESLLQFEGEWVYRLWQPESPCSGTQGDKPNNVWSVLKHVITHEHVCKSPVNAVDWTTKGAVTQSEIVSLVSCSQGAFQGSLCCFQSLFVVSRCRMDSRLVAIGHPIR